MQKKRLKKFAIAWMIGLLGCVGTLSAAPAAAPIAVPDAQTAVQEEVFLHTESFVKEHEMNGLFSECTEYFSAGDWNVKSAEFVMVYSVTQLKDINLSDFTVSLNGEPFYSGRFAAESGQELQTVKLPVPARLLKDGRNELKIESYIRTKDSLPCVDDVSKDNWFHVSKDSAVRISYTPKKETNSISDLYGHLTDIYALENKRAAVILPDAATNTAMTGAANILAGLSGNAGADYKNLMLARESSVFGEAASLHPEWAVYVGEWEFLPEQIRGALSQDAIKAMQEGAALALASLPDCKLLVLSGTDKAGLEKGARMFGNADYMHQMTGTVHPITAEENPIMEKKEPVKYASLTEEGAYVNGAFRQTFSFSQDAYANKMLSPSSQIYLNIRYAKNLDFNRSLMTVYINDIPIGSHKLSEEGADGEDVEFFVPADLEISGTFEVKAAFDLEIEDLWCTLRQGETPWAYVSPDSRMKIVLAGDVPMFFENYPVPFIENKSMNQVLFALPKAPQAEDLEALRGICLTLGQFQSDNAGMLTVKQGAEKEDCKEKNTIVIGTYDANDLVKEYNKNLYFQFSEDGKRLLTNEKKRITEEAGASMGTIQLLDTSSQTTPAGMLFVTGAVPKAMTEAAAYLSDTDKLWELTGDGCVVSGEELDMYQFKERPDYKADAVKEIVKRDDVFRLLVTGISVAAVLLVGLLFILVKRIRGRNKTTDRKGEK